MKRLLSCMMAVAFSLSLAGLWPVDSNAGTLPKLITWTAYDVGSGGYLQAAGVGDALMKRADVKLRVIPAGTDIGRLTPLKSGMADFALSGIGKHFAWRGIYDFASYSWGPQPLRQLWQVMPVGGMPLATTKSANIKTLADLKGKRLPWIPGAPALNVSMTAFLAFGDLTWDDVKKVPMGSWGAATNGLIDGKIDAFFQTGTAAKMYELDASPRGLYWTPFPCDDKAGWARMNKIAPYFGCAVITGAAGLTEPRELPNYPYPVLVTYPEKDKEYVYLLTKAIYEAYDTFKDTHPSMAGWEVKIAIRPPGLTPYHEGAVKFFKEVGAWSQELEDYNAKALAQEEKRMKLWSQTREEALEKKISEKQFAELWMEREAKMMEE